MSSSQLNSDFTSVVGHFYLANNECCRQDPGECIGRPIYFHRNYILHCLITVRIFGITEYAAAMCLHSRKIPMKLHRIFEMLAASFPYTSFWVLNIEINFQFTLFMQVWCWTVCSSIASRANCWAKFLVASMLSLIS